METIIQKILLKEEVVIEFQKNGSVWFWSGYVLFTKDFRFAKFYNT